MKTTWAKKDENRNWYTVDVEGKTLGRVSTQIARILIGKHKPEYTPFIDTGDFVVVINAAKIRVTGKKLSDKKYYRHSGYLGGLKEKNLEQMLDDKPEDVIKLAVKRMLPKNRLGRQMLKKLKVYAGESHPHEAQKPVLIEL
ncbi:MAG TPA: 50S ribosomal protein L13 [Flexistipes sinusarabici]|uniref:Large ribosomal subunit protein uL13 n=1 Tax=Flexistipes sinusarabici TaxID=2352 RepID=A0A3D5QB70_FLESI|nr:50S ribosomal protein L13 [Flexistipes sinusarabici]